MRDVSIGGGVAAGKIVFDPLRQGSGKGYGTRRGKGLRTPPAKRSNRLVTSKRVRRKHRRAA